MKRNAQIGLVSSTGLLGALLALAVAGLLGCWSMIQSRNTTIADLGQTNAASSTEITKLTGEIGSLETQVSELTLSNTELNETTVPTLKKQLSYANAANKRLEHKATARDQLQAVIASRRVWLAFRRLNTT